MPDETHLLQHACNYLALRCDEKMAMLQRRLQEEEIAVVQDAAKVAQEAKEQAAKLQQALRIRVPPWLAA